MCINFHVVVNWFPHLSIATRGVASPYRPIGPGLQIFYLTTLPLAINCAFLGELRAQSVGTGRPPSVSGGLLVIEI